MRINRSHPDDHFTIIPNAVLRDPRLSEMARGVLVRLLSHSDGWETNADSMWRQAQRQSDDKKRGTGRRAYRAAFAQLEECGYLARTTIRDKEGCFVTELAVYDTPQDRGTANGTLVNGTLINGTLVSETSVGGTSSRSTNQRSTKEEASGEEHSSSLADARAAAASASARSRETELNDLYEAVERLDDKTLRNALTTFENKRPRIYRQCRRQTAKQYNEKDLSILKGENRGRSADVLSYKYALRHYYDTADEWPAWLVRPLPKPVHLKSVS